MLRVFGPFHREGEALVQRDFRFTLGDIPLHMYELRNVVQPAHSVSGCTVGFDVLSPLTTEHTRSLSHRQDLTDDAFMGRLRDAARVLGEGWLDGLEVVAAVDDNAAGQLGRSEVPVVHPDDLHGEVDAIIPASGDHEVEIPPAARRLALRLNARLLPVFTSPNPP